MYIQETILEGSAEVHRMSGSYLQWMSPWTNFTNSLFPLVAQIISSYFQQSLGESKVHHRTKTQYKQPSTHTLKTIYRDKLTSHVFVLWEETGVPNKKQRTCKLPAKRRRARILAKTFLLQGDSAPNCAALL